MRTSNYDDRGAAKAALIDGMRSEIEQLRYTVQELLGRLWRDTFTGRDVG